MTAATVASPASAAKPRCQGKVATIVGTRKADKLVGTAKRDVIVAKGGADRIYGRGGNDLICAGTGNDLVVGGPGADVLWGQLGNDRLHGGPGPDFIAGQVGNDTLNGGLGVDKCFQGTGSGPWVNCEIPVPIPPEPPTLVIAYADVNTNHVYDAGDVMIAKIVDTNGDGAVTVGDIIKMGQYPVSPAIITPAVLRGPFQDWKVKQHVVTSVGVEADPDYVEVMSGAGLEHIWTRVGATYDDIYQEEDGVDTSALIDDLDSGSGDVIVTEATQSQPTTELVAVWDFGDDGFLDVDFAPGV